MIADLEEQVASSPDKPAPSGEKFSFIKNIENCPRLYL